MGVGSFLGIILIIAGLGFIAYNLYEQDFYLNQTAENLSIASYNSGTDYRVNENSAAVQFESNMRFAKRDLGYFIDFSCDSNKIKRFQEALEIITEQTGIITFYPIEESKADILVGCSEDSYEQEKNVFISGEGGPTSYLNLSFYPMVIKGKVLLYNQDTCDYPVTEIHELFHVFGFEHINDPKLIMYPYVDCNQKINPDVITELIKLYSIESLPELYFENVSATKRGVYLDFHVQINNEGLIDSENTTMNIFADNKKIKTIEFDKIEVGVSQVYSIENLLLPSKNVNQIKFVVASNSEEYNPENNIIELSL